MVISHCTVSMPRPAAHPVRQQSLCFDDLRDQAQLALQEGVQPSLAWRRCPRLQACTGSMTDVFHRVLKEVALKKKMVATRKAMWAYQKKCIGTFLRQHSNWS